ncbi:MAG TPA: hypothetical protein VE325_08620, partial [Burkholderiales bacterium]|nr:hypothetical protein [Burkholderiales bacterium]
MCIALAVLALAAKVQARDLTLAEAESLLVRNNRELQAARRATESAEAQRVIAGARPNATLSVNTTGISNNTGSGSLSQRQIDTVLRID